MWKGSLFGKSELQSKEEQKIKIDLVEGAPEEVASLPAAKSCGGGDERSRESRPSKFESIVSKMRMMEINQMGVISLCAIVAFLATAYVLPSLDEARVPDNFEATIRANDMKLMSTTFHNDAMSGKKWFDSGMKYMLADGVHLDNKTALYCFNQAVSTGYYAAEPYVGALTHTHHSYSEWHKSDSLLAIPTSSLAHTNDVDTMWQQLDSPNYDETEHLKKLRELADKGDSLAQYLVGYRLCQNFWPVHPTHLNGRTSTEKGPWRAEFDTGMEYLQRAAEAGFAPAALSLGEAYEDYNGPSTGDVFESYAWHMQHETHMSLARMWFTRAAMQGLPAACLRMLDETDSEHVAMDKELMHKYALQAATSTIPSVVREAAQRLDRMDEGKVAFEALCTTLGTTPKNLAKDLDNIVLDETCDNEATLAEIARYLTGTHGVPEDFALSNRVMIKRGQRLKSTYLDEAAEWLRGHGGDRDQIIKLYKDADLPGSKLKLEAYLKDPTAIPNSAGPWRRHGRHGKF